MTPINSVNASAKRKIPRTHKVRSFREASCLCRRGKGVCEVEELTHRKWGSWAGNRSRNVLLSRVLCGLSLRKELSRRFAVAPERSTSFPLPRAAKPQPKGRKASNIEHRTSNAQPGAGPSCSISASCFLVKKILRVILFPLTLTLSHGETSSIEIPPCVPDR